MRNDVGGRLQVVKSEVKPLTGIRVLDLGRLFAAPWAGQMLADLGAEVIKVERLDGDEIRRYGPPFLRDKEGRELPESAYTLAANRGKKSIAIDFAKPEGAELVRKLALTSDVLIENFKVGDLARRGLDYDTLKALKPSLIYCSITGFGQTGPYAKRPGVDTAFQAMSGMMSITGEPGRDPQKMGLVITDLIAGLYGVIAVLAGLRHREVNHGPGQHVDLALLDTAVAALSHRAMEYLLTGETPKALGTGSSGNVPARTFQCKAGILSVQAGGDGPFKKLCTTLGRTDLLEDARFNTRRGRVANEAALLEILNAIFLTRTAAEWFVDLGAAGIYCGPVNTIPEAFADPQVQHRELKQTMTHPDAGAVTLIANPIRFSETPVQPVRPPPAIGEHTREVLKDLLVMNDDQVDALQAAAVIACK